MLRFNFPVGYHDLHKIKVMDYQLNRWISLGYTDLGEMKQASKEIETYEDWKPVLKKYAQKALEEGRLMNATFNYRAAEFFTHPSDPEKNQLYDKFIDLFYEKLCVNERIERHKIPYGNSTNLYAMRIKALKPLQIKGRILIHGGFDSFMEEFYSLGRFFAQENYEVIIFEGPGQGAVLKKEALAITYEWEKSVSAILDYFDLDDITLLGISMGGWLCLRAAAFEKRIKKVICLSIAYDYMKIPPKFVEDFSRWLFKHEGLLNVMTDLKMKLFPRERWGIDQLMYITKTTTPLESANAILAFNEEHLNSEKVTQDILILSGMKDHLIPVKMHYIQVEALKNAHSITDVVFTESDHAHNHCQVGNIGLAVDTMINWLDNFDDEEIRI